MQGMRLTQQMVNTRFFQLCQPFYSLPFGFLQPLTLSFSSIETYEVANKDDLIAVSHAYMQCAARRPTIHQVFMMAHTSF